MKKVVWLVLVLAMVAFVCLRPNPFGPRPDTDGIQELPPNSRLGGTTTPTEPLRSASPEASPAIVQSKGVGNHSNAYTLTYSNITLTSVIVEGPMEKMIGTERFEELARKAYEESLQHEPKLAKIRAILESEKPDTDRLYSAIHLVYALRADVQDSRYRKFSEERDQAARIGELQSDAKLSDAERASLIQSEVNHFNLWKQAFDLDARNRDERFLRHMVSLVGELSEATLERLNSFEPQFGPLRFGP
jgi:hypothetical protein